VTNANQNPMRDDDRPLPAAPTLTLQVQLKAIDETAKSPVVGLELAVDLPMYTRLFELREACRRQGLSQVRISVEPTWLSSRPGADLKRPELVVDLGGITFVGEADEAGWPFPGARSHGRYGSAWLNLGVLHDALVRGASSLVLAQDAKEPLAFLEVAGREIDALDVATRTIVLHPNGAMSADEYRSLMSQSTRPQPRRERPI
jgi:hypothetical protein